MYEDFDLENLLMGCDDCDSSSILEMDPMVQVSEDFSKKQLFRHESELKDKKGGYLQGKVAFPRGEGTIMISCAPTSTNESLVDGEPLNFQPNLLLVSKMKRGQKRRRTSNGSAGGHSPDSTEDCETKVLADMWRIQLKQTNSGEIYYGDTLVGSNSILLFDSIIFPVTIMIPLQNGKGSDRVNIKRVLQSIDDSQEFSHRATILEHEFKRSGRFTLHEVRLRFQIKFEDVQRPCVVGYSPIILNQKHSSTGSMEIKMCLPHDPFCNHQDGKMFIMLVTKLDAVDAALVIMDGSGENQRLTELLKQPPKPIIIHHKVLIEVTIPKQIELIKHELTDETSSSSRLHLVLQSRDEKEDIPLTYGKFNSCQTCNDFNKNVVADLLSCRDRICGDGHKQPQLPIGLRLESAQALTPPASPPYELRLGRVGSARQDIQPNANVENEVSWVKAMFPICFVLVVIYLIQKFLPGLMRMETMMA
ncbi:hypothetical protein TCAL_11244 [Tigriopus californicus]|uniref:Uncharacterized protein n=1 Tax=Tigriopus californicus TaxID=6832 RepID=A0A553PCH5_TIGCA|nr:uncharacterized protein LOC131893441 [Tigriopus californicus]TRY75374.1 hypothetical protein TCAL_11244 [Tigriopus californicus]|eukprot:TCALIF_11244-PA protein Name:"Protein of unknown function" AED:0.00 eAED:0.00 QI:214/1/1/1/1/1/2/147/475